MLHTHLAPCQPCPGTEHLLGWSCRAQLCTSSIHQPPGQKSLQSWLHQIHLYLLLPPAGCCLPSSLLFCHLMAIFRTAAYSNGATHGCTCWEVAVTCVTASTLTLENPTVRFPCEQCFVFSNFQLGNMLSCSDSLDGLFDNWSSLQFNGFRIIFLSFLSTNFLGHNFSLLEEMQPTSLLFSLAYTYDSAWHSLGNTQLCFPVSTSTADK